MRRPPHVVIMAESAGMSFSPSGENFVFSGPDGALKIWSTSTNTLKQEYTPSSHLSATCCCLAWIPDTQKRSRNSKHKKKKRKSEVPTDDLIAMGTISGAVLIYNYTKGDLQTQLDGAHTDKVNSVAWHTQGDALFSSSSDQHVVEWGLAEGKVRHKWKADKGGVHSLCVCPTGKHLLTGGRKIKLWSLEDHQVLKTFTGHATEVSLLYSLSSHWEDDDLAISSCYGVSAAVNDRLVNAWHLDPETKLKTAVTAFSLPDEALHISVRQPQERDQPFHLLAITRSGLLVVFEHILNGHHKTPIKPKHTIQIATETSKSEIPTPIPIIAGYFTDDIQPTLLLSYGSFLRPSFEKLEVNASLDKNTCLVRQDPNKAVVQLDKGVSKVQTPGVSEEVKVLAPGHMAPINPTLTEGRAAKKRKKSDSGEMPMADRLNAMSLDKGKGDPVKEIPKANTLAILLAQGLQSQDKKILNHVLATHDEKIIKNTVKRLPVPLIVPLVEELARRMHGHAQAGHVLVRWIKSVLTVHTSYLTTFPELVDTLGSLYQMMDARVSLFSRLSKLQGKLNLMLSQVSSQEDKDDEGALDSAILVYQDESSDEDDLAMGGNSQDQSESEDNWEDEPASDEDEEEEDEEEENGMEEGDSEDSD